MDKKEVKKKLNQYSVLLMAIALAATFVIHYLSDVIHPWFIIGAAVFYYSAALYLVLDLRNALENLFSKTPLVKKSQVVLNEKKFSFSIKFFLLAGIAGMSFFVMNAPIMGAIFGISALIETKRK